jgi:SSS family solute:Na+ symporter
MLASFSTLDTIIVIVYLAISVGIGLLANRFITGMTGYLVAGRSLGTALSIATMTGSELGLITVMYQAQKGYEDGFKALHIGVIAGVITLLVGLTGFVVVRLRRSGVLTIPEFYQQRFGKRVRILGGVLLALGGILNMGLFLQVGGQFVVAATGLDPDGAMLKLVMTGLLVLVLVYTVLGGMVSVVLTDYVQFVVLSIGLIFMVMLVIDHFGMDTIVEIWGRHRGPEAFDPVKGHGPGYMSWQAVIGFVSCAIWPTAVTRALSARDERVVRRQYAFSSIPFMIRFLIPCFMGIAAYVFLIEAGAVFLEDGSFQMPHPEYGWGGGEEYASIQAFPVMLRELLPVGVLGLITAAMLAAFMSTHDSYLLCWSSVIARDVIAPLRGFSTEAQQLLWTRIGIVVIGVWVLFWGIAYTPQQAVWEYLGITGAIYFTGAIVVLVAGLYWKRASSVGAALALCSGFAALLGLGAVKKSLGVGHWDAEWIGLATLGLAAIAMIAGSLLFPDRENPAVEEA